MVDMDFRHPIHLPHLFLLELVIYRNNPACPGSHSGFGVAV
jgi:hypothetical protein